MILKNLALGAAVALTLAACDQNPLTAESTETVESTGVIREIDAENRRFKVTADGQILTLRANEQVRNFDQLEVGDRIEVAYARSVAVGMALPGDSGETVGVGLDAVAPEGEKPGLFSTEIVTGVVEFISYDNRSKVAQIRLEDDAIAFVHVPRELRGFVRAREPGDRIAVIRETAVAVAVTAAE